MDFLQQLEIWAKGDALQGKLMLAIGILLSLAFIFILNGNNPLVKGMLIPLSLLILINIGYGGFLAFSRPKHIISTSKNYASNTTDTFKQELVKAKTDDKNYSTLKPIWAVLFVLSIVLYFIFTKAYYQGLSLGFMLLFLGFFLLDTFLHQRLKPYLNTLQELVSG